ncbi:hypothetical protein MRX96_041332 [Rhipicephalus microplus]
MYKEIQRDAVVGLSAEDRTKAGIGARGKEPYKSARSGFSTRAEMDISLRMLLCGLLALAFPSPDGHVVSCWAKDGPGGSVPRGAWSANLEPAFRVPGRAPKVKTPGPPSPRKPEGKGATREEDEGAASRTGRRGEKQGREGMAWLQRWKIPTERRSGTVGSNLWEQAFRPATCRAVADARLFGRMMNGAKGPPPEGAFKQVRTQLSPGGRRNMTRRIPTAVTSWRDRAADASRHGVSACRDTGISPRDAKRR